MCSSLEGEENDIAFLGSASHLIQPISEWSEMVKIGEGCRIHWLIIAGREGVTPITTPDLTENAPRLTMV